LDNKKENSVDDDMFNDTGQRFAGPPLLATVHIADLLPSDLFDDLITLKPVSNTSARFADVSCYFDVLIVTCYL
jgi:hypothetical protein